MRRTLDEFKNDLDGWPLITADGQWGFGIALAVVAILGLGFIAWRVWRKGFDADARNNLIVLAVVCAGIILIAPRILITNAEGELVLPIRGYGVMLLLAVLAAVFVAVRRAKQVGLHPDVVLSLAFWVFLFGIAGARLLYLLDHPESFRGRSFGEILNSTLNVTQGGLVVYGGLLGGAVGFVMFCWKNKIKLLPFADVVVASLVLGQAIGRLGCLMNGCCFGGVCDIPHAGITFPWDSPPNVHQAYAGETDLHGLWLETDSDSSGVAIGDVVPGSAGAAAGFQPGDVIVSVNNRRISSRDELVSALLSADGKGERTSLTITYRNQADQISMAMLSVGLPPGRSQPVYPTQIYGFINGLLFFVFAWFLFPFRRRDGEVFAAILVLFPLTRFLMEIIRTDEPQSFLLGMTMSQNISLALSVSGVALWFWLSRQPKGNLTSPDEWADVNERFVGQAEES